MQKFKDIIAEVLKKKSFPFSNISELEGDASNRKYFKFHSNNTELILMLDNDKKSLKKFIKITNLIKKYVSVPKILADFSKENILILEDFGQTKYSEVMKIKNRQKLYMIAIDSLIEIQNKKLNLTDLYTAEKFLCESDLFFDWYVHPKKNINKNKINDLLFRMLENLNNIPKVFIHRDFHIDNLFFLKGRKYSYRCGWIDYQDALIGPCVYDLVSLTQDARVDIPKKLETFLANYYQEKYLDIDKDLFYYSYYLLAIQRHMKVLGIFTRLAKRDNKEKYLRHIPRVKKMLISNLKQNNFSELNELLLPLINNE